MKLFMVELSVPDVALSLDWYQTLGLTVAKDDSANGFILLNAAEGHLALKRGSPSPGTTAVVFEVGDLDKAIETLEKRGYKPIRPLKTDEEEGYREIAFHDPNNYEIRLFDWID